MKIFLYIIVSIILLFVLINVIPQKDVVKENVFSIKKGAKPLIIAHGSTEHLFPENTIVSFDGYMEIGVDVLEMDTRLTKDGVLVTHHDETIDRTSNGKGKVIDYTYKELKEFNFGSNFKAEDGTMPYENKKAQIISIDEIMDKYGKSVPFVIEIKDENKNGIKVADELVRIIRKHNMANKTLIVSFHDNIIEYIRKNYDGIMTNTPRNETQNFVINAYTLTSIFFKGKPIAMEIPVKESGISLDTKLLIKSAQRRNIAVHYWTINDKETMRDLIKKGADGIITDRPDLMREVLEEMNFK